MTTNSLREYKIKRTSSAQHKLTFTSQSITKLQTKIFVAHFHEYVCNSAFIVRQIYTVYFCIASLDMSVSDDDVANVLRTIAKLVGTKVICVCRFQKHVIPFFAKCRAYKCLITFVSTGIKTGCPLRARYDICELHFDARQALLSIIGICIIYDV